MEHKKIVIRSVYGKVKEYHFQPGKMQNGMNFPFVKPVRYNIDGTSELILSEAERNDPNSRYYLPEDLDIVVTDGTVFDLNDPLDANKWACIRGSELIVPTRDARDENGNFIIDGDSRKYGVAELYIDIPGEESERSVNKKKKLRRAYEFIELDSENGRLTKCKLLGKKMYGAPSSDVAEYLYLRAEKNPDEVIELYTSSDMQLRLLAIDGIDRRVFVKKDGLFMYGETMLGASEDAMIMFFKDPKNKRILDMVKFEVYPEYKVLVSDEPLPTTKTEPETTTVEENEDPFAGSMLPDVDPIIPSKPKTTGRGKK